MKKFYVVDHENVSEAWPDLKELIAASFIGAMTRYKMTANDPNRTETERTSNQAAYNALATMRSILLDDTQAITQAEWDARFGSQSKEAV